MVVRRLVILAALVILGAAAAAAYSGVTALSAGVQGVLADAPTPSEPPADPPVPVVETPAQLPQEPPQEPVEVAQEPPAPVHQRDVLRGRLAERAEGDVDSWHAGRLDRLASPLPGARVPTAAGQLPGAPRAYRNGYHEGVDFYDGYVGIAIAHGDPVRSAGGGIVTRADADFSELSASVRAELLARAAAAADTPDDDLDLLHGRQVWIDHGDGVVTRYSHLASVAVLPGDQVETGDIIGTIGNSGTSDGVRGSTAGAHLHFEIYIDRRPFWDGLTLDQVKAILTSICSRH